LPARRQGTNNLPEDLLIIFFVTFVVKISDMNKTTKAILAILIATIWISLSEFIRNEFLFKSYWVEHYSSMGLVFPSEMINGMVWGIWSLMFAIVIYFISRKFNLI
jgi:hypothetical protein